VLGDAWAREEARIQHSVLRRFGLSVAHAAWQDEITAADRTALATERAALLPPGGPVWPVSISHPGVGWVDFEARAKFGWLDWRQAFLDKFAELQFERDGMREEAT
jgi:hypothetical protein